MNLNLQRLLLALVVSIFISGCQKEDSVGDINSPEVSALDLEKIKNLGYSTDSIKIIQHEEFGQGYIVENDIILYDFHLNDSEQTVLRVGDQEQYRTTMIPEFGYTTVNRDGSTSYRREQVFIVLDATLPAVYWTALQEVKNRYDNVQGLRFELEVYMEGTSSFADRNTNINIIPGTGTYLGAAGPPMEVTYTTRSGSTYTEIEPFPEIRLIPGNINSTDVNHIATIMAHEIGHCIGFRHTDYFDTSISDCLGGGNEGPGEFGAVHIPGTPTGSDANSWMLACIGQDVNRPFTTNDIEAIQYIHGF